MSNGSLAVVGGRQKLPVVFLAVDSDSDVITAAPVRHALKSGARHPIIFSERMVPVLVITRKAGECLIIDGHTRVKVVAVDGQNVRLAIEAPKEASVVREELLQGGDAREKA